MSSMQFNYFSDKRGEQIIRKELLDKLGPLLVMDYSSGFDNIVEDPVDFVLDFSQTSLITSTTVKNYLTADEDGHLNLFNNPVIEYNDSVKLKVVQSDLSGQQSQPMIYFLNYFEMRRFSVSRNNC